MPEPFIDYYELMQISPHAEASTIVRVYRMLAARFHPDNPDTGDMRVFLQLNEAYRILSDPGLRADYDRVWHSHQGQPLPIFTRREFGIGLDGEGPRRLGLLTLLYSKRRTDPDRPGLSVLDLESSMATPREHLLFTLWYLKEKDLISQDETSDYTITHLGVDHVEQNIGTMETLRKLLKPGPDPDTHPPESDAG